MGCAGGRATSRRGDDDAEGMTVGIGDDPDEQLVVLADPDGHPFCIIVAPA